MKVNENLLMGAALISGISFVAGMFYQLKLMPKCAVTEPQIRAHLSSLAPNVVSIQVTFPFVRKDGKWVNGIE